LISNYDLVIQISFNVLIDLVYIFLNDGFNELVLLSGIGK